MANILPMEKQIMAISALTEGASIRGIERMTGIYRNTIMNLGLRVGKACEHLSDELLYDLPCSNLQLDEIWGFVKKKSRQVKENENLKEIGSIWTFIALDADTKLVPSYKIGKRNLWTAYELTNEIAIRLKNKPQISTDAWASYLPAIKATFGHDIDWGTIIKVYRSNNTGEGRYSPPKLAKCKKIIESGKPEIESISTSYVERQNLTLRMHCRRLARLTNAFSKKLENFKSAVALHMAWYNFVKVHSAIKTTPAVACGVAKAPWTIAELIERCDET
jgi:IS1 family transposase